MSAPEKNCSHKSWMAVTTLLVVLVAVSFIPPQTIGGVTLRRANIFADIFSFEDAGASSEASAVFNEAEFQVDMQEVAQQIEADTIQRVQTTFEWAIPGIKAQERQIIPSAVRINNTPVEIEDFSTDGNMRRFYDALLNAQRPVRIAFMGDSFVEGDILTSDLREKLQTAYGGGGTGFAPMSSPLTAFRRSIKTQAKGWTSYGIMQRKNAPAALRENFFVSGWVSQPSADASTRWENTDFRLRLDSCNTARVLFISPLDSRVEVTINDSLRREFIIPGDAAVRQIAVTAPHIHSLNFRVISGVSGFIGYGAVFESQGVVVDNYSIRSNNGQAMFWTNPAVNAQVNTMLDYDLVVLQYGLNIMQQGVRNYSNYATQIEKMVAYVRQCFPRAAVLILGVSDRNVRTSTGYAPMDALPGMLASQRQAAKNAGVAFWSTCEAMRSYGGMERFVANGWAGKDFTHINYAGGRRVAWSLFDALNADACLLYKKQQEMRRIAAQGAVIDTTQLRKIEKRLFNGTVTDSLNPVLQE